MVPDSTRESLLAMLRHPENRRDWDTAWAQFYDQYSEPMRAWCRRWGVQDHDADEITANVLAYLGERLKSFDYDPTHRFRDWLRKVVCSKVFDLFERRAKRPGDYGPGSAGLDGVADGAAAAEELCRDIEDRRVLLKRAMADARTRVEAQTWAAFTGVALDDRPADKVAAELSMTVLAVYQAKSRMLKLIGKIVDQLRGAPPRVRTRPWTVAPTPPCYVACWVVC